MMQVNFHGLWGGHGNERPVRVTREMLLRVVRYFRPYVPQTIVMLVTVAAIAVLGLVPPLLIRRLVDEAIPQRDFSLLVLLVIGMVVAPSVTGLLSVVQNYFSAQVSQRVM